MKLAKFAEKFDMDEDEMIDFLKENGYLKKNGDPSKKGEDYLDEDGNVTDSRSLKEELDQILEDEEDDDEEEDETGSDDDNDDSYDDEDVDEDEELDFDTLLNTVSEFDYSDKEEIAKLAHLAVNLLESYDNDEDEDEEDTDDDEENESDEDEDPNEPGKYRGWTISKKGIKVTATKGRRTLNTSVKGNIRNLIDEEEDED